MLLLPGHLLYPCTGCSEFLLPPLSKLQLKGRNEALIKDIMEDLDTNGDKQLSFEEFVMLIAKLVHASHEEMHKNTPKGQGHSHGPGLGEGVKGRGHCH